MYKEGAYRVTTEKPEKWRLPSGDARVAFYTKLTAGCSGGMEHQAEIHKLIRHIDLVESLSVEAEKRFSMSEAAWELETRNLSEQIQNLRVELSTAALRIDDLENHPFRNLGRWLSFTVKSALGKN